VVKRYGSLVNSANGNPVDTILNPATDQSMEFAFKLSSVAGYQDFTRLYDQYKIRAVKVSFIPIANILSATVSGYASLIYTTYDFNGYSGTLPTQDQIREYQYCKWSPYGKIHKRYFFPRALESSDSTKVGPQNWISTANADVLYHGLIASFSNVPSIPSDEQMYKVEVKYYLSFKNTK